MKMHNYTLKSIIYVIILFLWKRVFYHERDPLSGLRVVFRPGEDRVSVLVEVVGKVEQRVGGVACCVDADDVGSVNRSEGGESFVIFE